MYSYLLKIVLLGYMVLLGANIFPAKEKNSESFKHVIINANQYHPNIVNPLVYSR